MGQGLVTGDGGALREFMVAMLQDP